MRTIAPCLIAVSLTSVSVGCTDGAAPADLVVPPNLGVGCIRAVEGQEAGDTWTDVDVLFLEGEALFTFRQYSFLMDQDLSNGAARVRLEDLDRLDVALPLRGRLGPCAYEADDEGSGWLSCRVNGDTERARMSTDCGPPSSCFGD
jgi:hypothetical protein